MSDKDKAIAGLVVAAVKAGCKIAFERNEIGAYKTGGYHMHIGYLDEVVKELGDINLIDYINEHLKDDK